MIEVYIDTFSVNSISMCPSMFNMITRSLHNDAAP